MAKLRVLLDEDIPDDLKYLFPKKTQAYTVAGLGLSGIEDRLVIEKAVHKKCLIVTANKDFVPEYRKKPATCDVEICLLCQEYARWMIRNS